MWLFGGNGTVGLGLRLGLGLGLRFRLSGVGWEIGIGASLDGSIGLAWLGLAWTGLDWLGLDWMSVDRIGIVLNVTFCRFACDQ